MEYYGFNSVVSSSMSFDTVQLLALYILKRGLVQEHLVPTDVASLNNLKFTVVEGLASAVAAQMNYIYQNHSLYENGILAYSGSSMAGVSVDKVDFSYIDKKLVSICPIALNFLMSIG
jgi:hypothetical protein